MSGKLHAGIATVVDLDAVALRARLRARAAELRRSMAALDANARRLHEGACLHMEAFASRIEDGAVRIQRVNLDRLLCADGVREHDPR